MIKLANNVEKLFSIVKERNYDERIIIQTWKLITKNF
jgi:hypothetical protein